MNYPEQGDAASNEVAFLFSERYVQEKQMMQEINEENHYKLTRIIRGQEKTISYYLRPAKLQNNEITSKLFFDWNARWSSGESDPLLPTTSG